VRALATAATSEPHGVELVLEAAAIPSSRCRTERTARLSREERQLYRWILDRVVEAAPPTAERLAEQARALDLDAKAALAMFAREDLVHADGGAVLVAYPFSARARGHHVTIDAGRTVEAMCAIDALGISSMLDQPVEVSSRDPISRTEIRVRLNPDDGAAWEPGTAVVLAGNNRCDGPSYSGCCDALNFFESTQTAQHYLRQHDGLAGTPISIPEAIEAGRAIFGEILKQS